MTVKNLFTLHLLMCGVSTFDIGTVCECDAIIRNFVVEGGTFLLEILLKYCKRYVRGHTPCTKGDGGPVQTGEGLDFC